MVAYWRDSYISDTPPPFHPAWEAVVLVCCDAQLCSLSNIGGNRIPSQLQAFTRVWDALHGSCHCRAVKSSVVRFHCRCVFHMIGVSLWCPWSHLESLKPVGVQEELIDCNRPVTGAVIIIN